MFCEKCGAKNLETSNFCANCGFNLQHSKKVVESLHEEETENAEEPLVDPENVLEDGLLWDSGEISQVPDDADLEEGQAPQVSIEEREQVSDQEGADSEVGDGSLTNGGGDSTSDDKDIASDDGGDNFSPDVKKKSGGKSVLLFLLVLAVAGGYYWFSTNKNIPVSIKFMGNFSSYQIESGDGRKYMANSRGEFVFFDTVQLLKPDTFSFSFKLNNATSPAPFKFTWDGKSLAPIDLTHSISFVRESTNFQLSFNLVPYAEGIAVDVDGKTYEFGPDQVIRIPSVKVSRKKTFKIRAYSNSKKFNLAYNKDLVVQPDGRNRISESITLKPTFKGEYKFRFSVKDELGRKVEGAKVRIGYRNGASITDKDGIAELVIKDPAISATYSPEVVKGRMAPMEDLKSGSFTTDTYMFEYNVTLKVQDIISLTVVDVNGEPLANAQATTSDGKKAKSSRDGKITLVARNRGKITEISFRKPGYVDAMTSLTVAAGENIINNPIVLQPMNVRLRVLDKLTRRSIPNIGVKISGIPEELYTTDDPFQTLFELELNKEYNLTLTDHAGG